MRKTKSIKIDDLEITVKEVTLRQARNVAESEDAPLDRVQYFLKCCTDIDPEKLLDLAPSELELIWETFQEVNASFFKVARWAKLDTMLDQALEGLQDFLTDELADLFAPDTDNESGTTVGASS